jgi:mitogen-activated protein kinase organizer 1
MNYRLRSTLAANDSIALSGTEDGRILAWDILEGRVVHEMWHDLSMKGATASNRSVISTVLECSTREEWCSAGGDGKSDVMLLSLD